MRLRITTVGKYGHKPQKCPFQLGGGIQATEPPHCSLGPGLHNPNDISIGSAKAVTRGVFSVFEHPRNFREKLDTQKQIYY